MMRQVAGAFMEYEKGRLVAKLRGARERKRKETGKKVGGRKSHAELWPEVVAEARRLRKAKGKAGRLSYREISARLREAGYCNERGQPFNPQSVRAMIDGPQRRSVQSVPRFEKSRIASRSFATKSLYPSLLGWCAEPGPVGGTEPRMGRQG